VVKDLSKELNKKANLEIYGQEVELDKNIIEAIGDPLVHILRNSLDHGLECPEVRERKGKPQVGKIILKAYHLGGQVIIDIIDDGSGINIEKVKEKIIANNLVSYEELEKMPEKEIMMFIMKPGFSTAETVSKVSGRGVGMDVVKSTIEKLGGRADIDSVYNEGTTLRLKLPLTLAIVPCMITRVEDYFFAIPQVNIVEIVWLYGKDVYQKIEKIQDNEIFRLRDILLPLVRLSSILKIQKKYVDPDTKEIKEERRINLTDRRKNKSGETENAADDFSDQRTIDDRRNSIDNSLYIIVCRINQNLLGLIVDEAIDTEEIVVKSIHDEIKKNRCYAGATVLGDGKIALILDVPGIAETAKLNFNSSESAIQKKQNISSAGDIETQTIFLFKNHPEEIFGIFLSLIARISVIKSNQIKRIGGKEFFIHNNESIP
ncbi:MAG TPA: chemotaxis protein CheW, partial [bacterium]|nr:chemotaxis protein CheW [bacterium]